MIKYIFFLSISLFISGCAESVDREDINLMVIISNDQMQVNDNLVKSLRMHLEFYGASSGEDEYYASSERLQTLRKTLINENDVAGLLSYADSVESYLDPIGGGEDGYLDQLNIFYRRKITDEFDSLSYYKFLYTTLKKEYRLHSYNAEMMTR